MEVLETCLSHGFKLDTKVLNFGYSTRLKGNECTTINFMLILVRIFLDRISNLQAKAGL
jgi:hypothetical protein